MTIPKKNAVNKRIIERPISFTRLRRGTIHNQIGIKAKRPQFTHCGRFFAKKSRPRPPVSAIIFGISASPNACQQL